MPKINRSGKNSSQTTGTDSSIEPFWQTTDGETVRLYQGNCVDVLRRLPEKSVHCVVTSPPYWGLRDYGTGEWVGGDENCDHRIYKGGRGDKSLKQVSNGGTQYYQKSPCPRCGAEKVDHQLGSEKTPEEFVENMVAVFREVRRVLRDDGTCWLNLGDSYASGGGSSPMGDTSIKPATDKHRKISINRAPTPKGIKPGNLVGIPWRVALALQADGWVLRQDIIWHKPSPMPESVRNRCTKAHEYIFLLTKSNRYFYDAEAIKETATGSGGGAIGKVNMEVKSIAAGAQIRRFDRPDYAADGLGRNKRSIWTIASEAYSGAHFATFPRKLIEPCILAGTSEYGACSQCGAPWRRVLEEKQLTRERPNEYVKRDPRVKDHEKSQNTPGKKPYSEKSTLRIGNTCANTVAGVQTKTVGWEPTCDCGNTETAPCTVLDPFIGSGTSCVVSLENGRHSVGIDLSANYLEKNAVPRIEGALMSRPKLARLAGKGPKRIDIGEGVVLTSESLFKIGAHAIVFGLIGAWIVSRYWLYGILAIVFTVVEVLAFFVV